MAAEPRAREHAQILRSVERYYSSKFAKHGAVAQGVDWSSVASQELRFAQLLNVCNRAEERFSLIDYGCGYGALVPYLVRRGYDFVYRGYDVSPTMSESARAAYADPPRIDFVHNQSALEPADYTVASGIFNVKLETDDDTWMRYVLDTLNGIAGLSDRGFAFNVLTRYSDPDCMRADLFYADPALLFDHCKTQYSKNVALLHDYDLYEFTVIVRLG